MDFSKIGTKTWSEPGRVPQSKDAISGLKNDIEDGKVTNSIGDLLQLSRSRSNRQFMQSSASASALPSTLKRNGATGDLSGRRMGGSDTGSKKQTKNTGSTLHNVVERPATRHEIEALNVELQDRIKSVMENSRNPGMSSTVMAYEPHKDAVALIRDRMLHEFGASLKASTEEPWLEDLIKCECIRDICDSTALKLTDMLSVSSTEFGNVLRKLRQTYREAHEQMREGWVGLRERYVDVCAELESVKVINSRLETALQESEQDIRSKIDAEVFEMRAAYEEERSKDREHVLKTEQQMAEMSVTLRDLNALFKTMQGDADAAIASDTMAHCRRLEQEVQDLEQTVSVLAKTKEELHQEQKRSKHQESEISEMKSRIEILNNTVNRQDETIANLMGREAMHHAEIDKLKKMAAEAKEKEEDLEFDQTATALLCIKCKKSLDDLSNIRDAVLGSIKPTEKLMCQNFRILLPNLKGRRPSRDSTWVRKCMRAILMSKMREVCALMPMGVAGRVSGFPEFVYSWFDPVIMPPYGALSVGGSSTSKGSAAATAYAKADEDRWGFYYGVKSMSRENMEAKLVWSLLDEAQGEDGLAFVMNCLSVALSLGGTELWRQFGDTSGCDSVGGLYFPDNESKQKGTFCSERSKATMSNTLPPTIWLRLEVAKHAVKLILVRALEPQMHATMDAIEALKESPDIENPLVLEDDGLEGLAVAGNDSTVASAEIKESKPLESGPEPTHIDMFVWLRILLQRFQEEQSHRSAAVRLMFDTASVGALTATPTQPAAGDNITSTDYIGSVTAGNESAVVASLGSSGSGGESHVEFPQFLAILKTLYPSISASESASLFGVCYELGLRKVTANVFLKVAESAHLFSRSMRLAPLPILRRQPSDYVETQEDSRKDDSMLDRPHDDSEGTTRLPPPKLVPVSADIEQKVRKSLGAFVHSRSKMIEPEVRRMVKDLPERWRMVLLETYIDLNTAIVDNFAKIRTAQRAKNNADRNAGATTVNSDNEACKSIVYHLDGIQPYLLYRKLLSLMLLFESLCDNPLLPGDLLTTPLSTSASARRGFGTVANQSADSISLHHARSIILNIESAVLGKRYKASKIAKFEAIRFSVSARRIQHTFLRLACSKELAVPLIFRNLMRSGYLTGRGRGPSGGHAISQFGLRARKVYMEPWCAQAVVAEIYYFKIMYDRKARFCDLPLLDLKLAVISSHWNLWGCPEISELSIHDFCNAVKNYMHGLPRLRLFAAFVGFSDLDQPIAGILSSPLAVNMYLQLILLIHKEVLNALAQQEGITPQSQTILFPCMENPLLRPDKRDFWKCDPELLLTAVGRWTALQPSHIRAQFTDIFDKLHGSIDRDGLMDVDDMLWVVLMQWARVVTAYCNRIAEQSENINNTTFCLAPLEGEMLGGGSNMLPLNVNERRSLADFKYTRFPVYPADVSDFFSGYINKTNLSTGVAESENGQSIIDDKKIAVLSASQVIRQSGYLHPASGILSAGTFLAAKHKRNEPIIEKSEAKDSKREPPSVSKQARAIGERRTKIEDGHMILYLQELMVWSSSPTQKNQKISLQSLGGIEAGESGSVDMFASIGAASAEEMENSETLTGDSLLRCMPITSAVSATISMWHLVRLWSILSGAVASFLETAGKELNTKLEFVRECPQKDKSHSGAEVLEKLASFSAGSEGAESDISSILKVLLEYSDMIEDAIATSHSLHICCGTIDPSQSAGNGNMPRTSSTIVNPSTDYSDETTAEAWKQMRQLFTITSKLSTLLSIPFPYDEGGSKAVSGRKLQLERASVYAVQVDRPIFF